MAKKTKEFVIRPTTEGQFINLSGGGVFPVALGNGTQHRIGVVSTANEVWIGVEGWGFYPFNHFVQASYVNEKIFQGKWLGDAKNLADFINCQLMPFEAITQIQGRYSPDLCKSE